MAVPLSNLTATWASSASAVNTAIGMNVTDTASAANSMLINIKVNGTSKFSVDKGGNILANSQPLVLSIPTGTIFPYAGTSEPDGYLFCTGNAISRSTYSSLYSAIGTTYGAGDGASTFNLPDLRGRVIAGRDNMSGTAANRLTSNVAGSNLGATGGTQTHVLTETEIPAHDHDVSFDTANRLGGTSDTVTNITAGGGSTANGAARLAGGGQGHNNVQPTIVLNYIIKT